MLPATDKRSLWYGSPGADDSRRSPDEVRLIREMTSEAIEEFLNVNKIDTSAAKELRSEAVHVALAVLDRGPLRACNNPSGALVARIRDARRGAQHGRGTAAVLDPNASEADRFLAENRIDDSGVASFRAEADEVQKGVMAKGPLVNTTNPSASLMARIRTVKGALAAGLPVPTGRPGPPAQNPAQNPALSVPLSVPGSNGQPIIPALATAAGLGAAGVPAVQQPQPPALAASTPALSLEDSSPAIHDAAQKAIDKLRADAARAEAAAQPPTQDFTSLPATAFAASASTAPAGGDMGAEDRRLQDEALRAIQALNGA